MGAQVEEITKNSADEAESAGIRYDKRVTFGVSEQTMRKYEEEAATFGLKVGDWAHRLCDAAVGITPVTSSQN